MSEYIFEMFLTLQYMLMETCSVSTAITGVAHVEYVGLQCNKYILFL